MCIRSHELNTPHLLYNRNTLYVYQKPRTQHTPFIIQQEHPVCVSEATNSTHPIYYTTETPCMCITSHELNTPHLLYNRNTLYVYQKPRTQHTPFVIQQKHPVCVSEATHSIYYTNTFCFYTNCYTQYSYSSHFHARRFVTKPPNDSLNLQQHTICIRYVSVLLSTLPNVLHRPSMHSCLKMTLRIETCSNLRKNSVF